MENEKIVVYGQDYIVDKVDGMLKNLKNGKGGLLLLEGDIGTGKTHILNYLDDYAKNKSKDYKVVLTETQVPVANLKIGTLQPFQPFLNVLEELGKPDSNSKFKFAANVGLTLLASVPIVGEFAYAYKEISKDLKQFKEDSMKNKSNDSQAIYQVFIDKFNKIRQDKKIVILLDNMHWSDAQSIEFLNGFIDSGYKDPILIICTYNDNVLKSQAMPWMSIVDKLSNNESQQILNLKALDKDDIRAMSKSNFNNYKQNQEFEEWIYGKSEGNPGIISEYIRFFSKNSPFDSQGQLATNFKDNEYLPGTWSAVFSLQIERLSEDEKHILTVCAGEGIEFTVNIISKLLSLDILETIKKLRSIQNKSGLIKSQGAQQKYGIISTTYKFSQVFYHSFFENLLEYEERVELHSKISELLKIQFANAKDEDVKNQIAPYLAAHSIESGDTETAKEALHYTAQSNKEIGGDEFLDGIKSAIQQIDPNAINLISSIDNLKELNNLFANRDLANVDGIINGSVGESVIDFNNIKKSIINDMINDNTKIAVDKINMYLNNYSEHFNDEEKIQFYTLLSKTYIDIKKSNEAKQSLDEAEKLRNESMDKNIIVMLNNGYALYYYSINNMDSAYKCLNKYEEYYKYMTTDTKILTYAIASRILNSNSDSSKFKEQAIKLSEKLNYNDLKNELANY